MPLNYPSDWRKMDPRVPFVGKWASKITMIEKMWMQPCSPSPLLFILGSFAATPAIVFSLLTPDCFDHTFDRVRAPHHGRRKVGINVADWAKPITAPSGGYGWAMWKGAQFAQRVGFYALLVDGLLDWVVYGTSFAYQLNGCDDPLQGYATSKMDGKVWRLLPAQTFTMNTWDVEAAHIFLADGASIVTPAGHEAAAGFTLTQIPNQFPPLQDCTFRAQMVDQLTFDESPWQLPFTNQDGRPSVSLGNFFPKHHPGGHNFRIVIEKTEGVLYGDGTFTAGGLNLTSFSPSACGKDISRP